MKKKLCYLFLIMFLTAAAGAAVSYISGNVAGKNSGASDDGLLVVTSFYPVYVIAENLADGVNGIRLQNLTANQTGCLHDYQLTTRDMKLLEEADVFLMNGGGIENFFEGVMDQLPELTVVTSSDGIEMLPEAGGHNHGAEAAGTAQPAAGETAGTAVDAAEGHAGDGEQSDADEDSETEHSHGEYNAHIWLDPNRYEEQVRNLAEGLIELDPENRVRYEENRDNYIEEIRQVRAEYEEAFLEEDTREVIIFHDAFAYLAEWLPFEVAHAVTVEGENTALSAGELAEVIEEIRRHDIRLLFVEEQYGASVAAGIAGETDAEVLVLDSLVTGAGNADSWVAGMRNNLELLKETIKE